VETLVNLVGLIGALCLAYVAIRADRYGHLIARLRQIDLTFADKDLAKDVKEATLKSLNDLQNGWSGRLSFLIRCGVFLTALSYILELFKIYALS
jgi:hypothetical protein